MKHFKKFIKPLIGIVAVVPFGLIGMLVVGAMASKSGLNESKSGAEQHHEVNNPIPSSSMIIDGETVVIRNSTMSRLSQSGCLEVGKPCETPPGRWVGVWGETVFKRNPS